MQQQSSPVLQQLRSLHPGTLQALQSPDGTLYPQTLPELQNLHANDVYHQHQQYTLNGPPPPQSPAHAIHFEQHGLPSVQFPPFPPSYQHAASPRFALTNPLPLPGPAQQQFHSLQPLPPPRLIQHLPLPPPPQPTLQHAKHVQLPRAQLQAQAHEGDDTPSTGHGQFQGLKLIADPPDLEKWRERLFNVDDTITLTEEEFQTYFPHVDNVYSHRSTQHHKRKRFVSHYWDCRLKGRPPGTKKSTDPDKKKRKRVARERDLCDVKIKVTEYFDGREYEEQVGHKPPGVKDDPESPLATNATGSTGAQVQQYFGQPQMLRQQPVNAWDIPPPNLEQPGINVVQFSPPGPMPLSRSPPRKYYTFQRVNGNGGNGKGDGVAGPHKHTLEESDRVKKNSVLRWLAKGKRDDRKKPHGGDASEKTYHKKATGNAWTTVKSHSKDDDLKLYGSCFCPFVQRVWIALEHKQMTYQYIEVDPYKKPQSLIDVNPRGLVPALRHGPTWSTHESTVILEYLEDLNMGPALLPRDAQPRATSRLWGDHVNRNIVPWFYKLLQAQDQNEQVEHAKELRRQISKLVDAADATGPFFLGSQMSFVDVQIAPWMIRLRRVLGPYRGWPEAEEGSRWKKWVDGIENDRSVRMTTSTDDLYIDSYERYAENRPGTSLLADAVNSGRGLP